MRLRGSTAATILLFAALAFLGALFLASIGIDALEGRSSFQFFADSNTYHDVARGDLLAIEDWTDAVGIGGNFIGPLAVLRLTGENYYLVMLLNVALLCASVLSIASTLRVDALRFSIVLLANPVVLSSALSVNKEVLGIAAMACLVRALTNRSLALWCAAAVLSFLMRWQMTLFVVAVAVLASPINPIRARRGLTLATLLVGLSVVYVMLSSVLELVRLNFDEAAQDYEGSGFYTWLVGMQDSGYYWLVFPLKAAHLLFGSGLRIDRLLMPVDLYNDVVQVLHSGALLVLFALLLRKRRMRLDNDLIYLSAIYLTIFALSPIYTPRYFLLVYVLWAAAWVAGPNPMQLFAVRRRQRRKRLARPPTAAPSLSNPNRASPT